jgi:hypothetical protein
MSLTTPDAMPPVFPQQNCPFPERGQRMGVQAASCLEHAWRLFEKLVLEMQFECIADRAQCTSTSGASW